MITKEIEEQIGLLSRPGLYTYDKVWNRKKYFEIPVFLPIEKGMSPE